MIINLGVMMLTFPIGVKVGVGDMLKTILLIAF
jgi:hypothetical protein